MLKSNKIIIISDSGKDVGLGHYSRSKYLSKNLKHFLKKYKLRIFYYRRKFF